MPNYRKADPMYAIMYQKALLSLAGGHLDPINREVLSHSPLPSNFVEPFAAQEVDTGKAMDLAYNAVSIWIDEAKKANYFSGHFLQLSKLVMNAVTVMGRGLVSLHARGEDLSSAPMSIGDLIGVASYHFRKSYLGVVQTAKFRPEVSERLLVNQLSWLNMILRLYKTKEKLEQPVVSGTGPKDSLPEPGQKPAVSGTELTAAELTAEKADPIVDPAALFVQGSLKAPCAFSSLDGYKAIPTARDHSYHGEADDSAVNNDSEVCCEMKMEKKADPEKSESNETQAGGSGPGPIDERESEIPEFRSVPEKDPGVRAGNKGYDPETGAPEQANPEQLSSDISELDDSADKMPPEVRAGSDDPSEKHVLPAYLEVLDRICSRSSSSGEGELSMTFDEIRFLALDPEFNAYDPRSAAEFRRLLQKIDSG